MSVPQRLVSCNIRIKQEAMSWNWNSNNHTLRKQRQEELQRNFEDDFFRVLNAVVDCGGVFCASRHNLDSEWRLFSRDVQIKIPQSAVESIKILPQLESFIVVP